LIRQIKPFLESLRPKQWIKNVFLFAGIVFSGKLFELGVLCDVVSGFALFSLGAGSVYLLNDLKDIEEDRLHPEKCKRPLPSGRLSGRFALLGSIILMGLVVPVSLMLNEVFGVLLLIYLAINILYSLKLKNIVIIDVMIIAAGFTLRVLAGTSLVSVRPSDWLTICTINISLFLGFCKRRSELSISTENSQHVRMVLMHYSPTFLDQMISVVTASTVVSYMLYTVSSETVAKFGTRNLIYTTPFVLYGIFRYLYLIYQRESEGDPTSLLLTDKHMLVNIGLWLISVLYILYK
jgi:4-hydroxybenzoate polyprenyltransferase